MEHQSGRRCCLRFHVDSVTSPSRFRTLFLPMNVHKVALSRRALVERKKCRMIGGQSIRAALRQWTIFETWRTRVTAASSEAAIFWAGVLSVHWTRVRRERSARARVPMCWTWSVALGSNSGPMTRSAQEATSDICERTVAKPFACCASTTTSSR